MAASDGASLGAASGGGGAAAAAPGRTSPPDRQSGDRAEDVGSVRVGPTYRSSVECDENMERYEAGQKHNARERLQRDMDTADEG